MSLFLDKDKPLHTCKEENCLNCDVSKSINCHFYSGQLTRFLIFGMAIFIIGGVGVFLFSPWALVVWLVCIISYFGLIEIRVMCSHCPHYAEPGLKSLKCWANYGSPKLWRYRPGPMSIAEKIVFFAGLIIIFLSPVVFILLVNNLLLLAIYVVILAAGTYSLRHFLCGQCMNFACPLNHVDQKLRDRFFSHNPAVSEAWKKHENK